MRDHSEKRMAEWRFTTQLICREGIYYTFPDCKLLKREGLPSFLASIN